MKNKICFFTTGDIKSIATMKRALGMANPLSKLGWEVSIIALDTIENKRRILLEANLARVHFVQKTNPLNEVILKNKILKKIKPNFVWVCSLGFRNLTTFWKYPTFIEHSELGSSIQDNRGLKNISIKFFEFLSIYHKGLICASHYLKEYFEQKSLSLKREIPIHYSPYAYNEDVISMSPIIYDDLKIKYGEYINFVYMGTITENYGLFTMLEAAKILKNDYKDFRLFLLGRGRHIEKAKLFMQKNNLTEHVILTDYVQEEHLSSYFHLANAFISPLNNSIQDKARCPSKIYMYLPFRKPILTCKIGEPSYIFQDKGFYFDNLKPETLSEMMKSICAKKTKSVENIDIKEHSWEYRASNFDQWVKKLANEKKY